MQLSWWYYLYMLQTPPYPPAVLSYIKKHINVLCVYVCVDACVYVCAYMWNPEVTISFLPQSLSILFLFLYEYASVWRVSAFVYMCKHVWGSTCMGMHMKAPKARVWYQMTSSMPLHLLWQGFLQNLNVWIQLVQLTSCPWGSSSLPPEHWDCRHTATHPQLVHPPTLGLHVCRPIILFTGPSLALHLVFWCRVDHWPWQLPGYAKLASQWASGTLLSLPCLQF